MSIVDDLKGDKIFLNVCVAGDVSCRIGSSVIDSLLSLWMHAVGEERIPSPSYWRTLNHLSAKWRHHVPFHPLLFYYGHMYSEYQLAKPADILAQYNCHRSVNSVDTICPFFTHFYTYFRLR